MVVIVIQIVSKLSAEHLEDLVELGIKTAVLVNVLKDTSGLLDGVLDEIEPFHLVVFLRVGL